MSLDYAMGVGYFLLGLVAMLGCMAVQSGFWLVAVVVMVGGQILMNVATSAAANRESRDILKSAQDRNNKPSN